MKKILALLLSLTLMIGFAASCSKKDDADVKSEGVMTYAEYDAAAVDSGRYV